ncbi:MAG: hypothetical protein PHC94_12275 [Methylobacter sp.]|nr:hypothetical protein [Methylobacter sp.]
MNIKLITLLISVCAGLLLVIAGEWLYAKSAQQQLLTSLTTAKVSDSSPDELPKITLTEQPESSYEDLVARPLFVKGRKPVDEPSPEQANAAAAVENFDWQLNGIYTSNKGQSVLISRAKTSQAKIKHRRITVGEELDGWKLTEIGNDKVILIQGGEQKELLLRKPKPKTAPIRQPANAVNPAAVPPAEPPVEQPPEQTEVDTTEIPQ